MILRFLTAAALAAAALPSAASATPAPHGRPCSYVSVESGGTAYTVLYAGPVAAPGAASVRITCTFGSGWPRTHAGATGPSETSLAGPGVAVIEPRATTHPPVDSRYLCSTADVDGTTWYAGPGGWTTTAPASCAWSVMPDTSALPPETRPVVGYALCLVFATSPVRPVRTTCDFTTVFDALQAVDLVVCPALVAARPGAGPVAIRDDGDLYVHGELVWDCYPYEPLP